jgi:hypothetical protein
MTDIEVTPHAPPTEPILSPDPGQMWCVLTMGANINEQMVQDLMVNIADNLQTVTHLINYADFQANVAGVILTHSADILPAMTGDLAPTPTWLETGEQTVNA